METPKLPKLLILKKIEEKALKEYPDKKMEWTTIDINEFRRNAYVIGYLQAQADIMMSMGF